MIRLLAAPTACRYSLRSRVPGRRALWLSGLAIWFSVGGAAAQLRPLDPAPWMVWWQGANHAAAQLGGGVYTEQRASLAGVQGRLLELGNFEASWQTGRVTLGVGGTLQRWFEPQTVFAAATADAVGIEGGGRHDSGDYRVSTSVRLTPDGAPVRGVLRFGTRLPTTDNQTGLDRDQTDFFATLGAGGIRSGLRLAAEAGIGINGSRDPRWEQNDVLLYVVMAEYPLGPIVPSATWVGQQDGLQGWVLRGTEDLSELRLGVRVGSRRWLEARVVHGFTPFSPQAGLQASAGVLW